MRKKMISAVLAAVIVLISGCQDKPKNAEGVSDGAIQTEEAVSPVKGAADVSDFKVVANIDSHMDAKFSINALEDFFVLYTAEDLNSKSIAIAVSSQNQFGSLYVFGESEKFYRVHYQLVNEPRTTVLAYVPKNLFTKDSHQQIKSTVDLNTVRSISIKGKDINAKSFEKYGRVSFSDEGLYKQAMAKIPMLTEPNDQVTQNKKEIIINTPSGKHSLEKHSFDDEVETQLSLIGYSAIANKVIIKEVVDMQEYYAFYDINKPKESTINMSGLPRIASDKKRFVALHNANDVGIDFSLWVIHSGNLELDTYVNFTEFKLFAEDSYAWLDDKTIIVKVLHSNSLNTVIQRQETDLKPQFIKIKLQ
ncbi:hypothetical protein [Flavobacterium sp. NKUCC04_CG]|uniref:hypothetical protein n=1 Tax=Flavobacterium sp. NKUCC04_CG TaxID=2842121 RepID=UPI001C5A5D16|nr:hypothetical protein [Flavobacterium sp. NKUCC04_CG]MBW3519026.1 hypothetical protein [Flavobacterium sp. NKUCC04_CG]